MSESTEPTDAELMRRARRDAQAFDGIYARHARSIQGWLARETADQARAWELTAEVFAQAWLSRRRFRPGEDGSAAPWLFGIARNVLRHANRRRTAELKAIRKLGMQLDLATPSHEDDNLERLVVEAMGGQLHRSLDQLPPEQRAAVELRVVDELPYEEVARRLDCTVEAARVRVLRGLRTLRAGLGGRPA
jgi:RNA polymerase sigma-70 factor (ECF subfamily)